MDRIFHERKYPSMQWFMDGNGKNSHYPGALLICTHCHMSSWWLQITSQLALRRWPNVGPTSTLTLGQRRLTNVGPTWICQLAQRWPNIGTPTLGQHRPNVGTLTLGQHRHNVTPMVVCQRFTNIGPTEAALLAFCEGNPSVTDRSPVEQTVELNNQWFETPMWSTSM